MAEQTIEMSLLPRNPILNEYQTQILGRAIFYNNNEWYDQLSKKGTIEAFLNKDAIFQTISIARFIVVNLRGETATRGIFRIRELFTLSKVITHEQFDNYMNL